MVLFKPPEIIRVTRGHMGVEPDTNRPVESVVIDSRMVRKNSLFAALPGTKTDGHEFIEDACLRGASICLISEDEWVKRKNGLLSRTGGALAGVVVVDDTLKALQSLAAFHLRKFQDLVRIGITGSNGKTTTKEIAGSILSKIAKTTINKGNLNSEIGLPLSVFTVGPLDRFAVFEMGISQEGEMDVLADIVRPHVALITNIGTTHIEFLGSKERIAKEKKKIFKYFGEQGKGFLYENEAFYEYLEQDIRGEIYPFGQINTKGFSGSRHLGLDGSLIDWEGLQVHFPLFGSYNLINALGAISLTSALGAGHAAVENGLEEIKPLFGRSQIIKGSITVLQDCYNANPDSVKNVLDFFHFLKWDGRKVLILGSMLELGGDSEKAHMCLGRLIHTLMVDISFFFGKEMEAAYKELKQADSEKYLYWTCDFEKLLIEVTSRVKPGDLVLIKGSRGARMERLVEPLLQCAA